MTRADNIILSGVRTNNLKHIDCEIPMRRLTVLTGVSGSGKSSLAFDTLYAEGQRRFLESMSTYVRMFLNEMPKPPVDKVEHCLPAIALRQQSSFDHPRSTVSTVTELLFYMAQIFALLGEHRCHVCGGMVGTDSDAEIGRRLSEIGDKLRLVVYVKISLTHQETPRQRLSALAAGGYQRLWIDGQVAELSQMDIERLLDMDCFPVLIDRVLFRAERGVEGRLAEALEEGFKLGAGRLCVDILESGGVVRSLELDRGYACRECHAQYSALRPEYFDVNSTLGACPKCTGFGAQSCIDWHRVFSMGQSVEGGGVVVFRTPSTRERLAALIQFCRRQGIATDVPLGELSQESLRKIMSGVPPYKGIEGYFQLLMSKNTFLSRMQIARYRGYEPCTACAGSGLNEVARNVWILGRTFGDVLKMTVSQAREFFESIDKRQAGALGAATPLEEACLRLCTMDDVGLGYLALNRKSKTLSGGEAQRLYLSCGLGRGLTDTLYVLDEPTAGLHPADSRKLIRVMRELVELGNTLVVVEHDPDVIEHADKVIELGPMGGENGGHIIFSGSVGGLRQSKTPTGEMLRDASRTTPCVGVSRKGPAISVEHATIHNLCDVSVCIPTGQLVAVAGVSGSGKSTLIHDVLYRAWLMENDDAREEKDQDGFEMDVTASVHGLENFDNVVMMSQGALGRSLRACVATMTNAYTGIRTLFARQPGAVELGFSASTFSFNTPEGRCPECEGLGMKTIEMMFLNDLTVPCPACGGRRFAPQTLSVVYGGKNIDDVLHMTVDEARCFFADYPSIASPLQTLSDVGLGYVRLGQSTSTLSGGEFQRLRLSSHLENVRADNSRLLFIFDEPTVGLHMQDVACLMKALRRLVKSRASVIVIEHNLDLVAQSDHVIELGPSGGPGGGRIIFEGSPRMLLQADTPTGRALKRICQ